jgi:hypothetical protein
MEPEVSLPWSQEPATVICFYRKHEESVILSRYSFFLNLFNSIWNTEDKAEGNNYRWISLLATTHKILSNILVSRLRGFIMVIFDVVTQLLLLKWLYSPMRTFASLMDITS